MRCRCTDFGNNRSDTERKKPTLKSDLCQQLRLHLFDLCLITSVKRPLLDALAVDESGLGEDFEVLAQGGVTHAQFLSDVGTANPITHEIAVHLRRKMPRGLTQPLEDLQPPRIGDGAQHALSVHIDS